MPKNQPISRHAVIITAIGVEYDAVRTHLASLRQKRHKGSIYQQGIFETEHNRWVVSIFESGMGNADAAIQSERAINYFHPVLILFVGVAGGLKDVHLGSVVAATKVYSYESGKESETFQARPEVIMSPYYMVNLARYIRQERLWQQRIRDVRIAEPPEAIVAPIAAGGRVVASTRSDIYHFLREYCNDAVAVEMEGWGFLKAVHANQHVDAQIIRGISDLIDGKSEADAANSQQIAAGNASAFAFELLAQWREEKIDESEDKEQEQRSGSDSHPDDTENIQQPATTIWIANLQEHYEKLKKICDNAGDGWVHYRDRRKRVVALLHNIEKCLPRKIDENALSDHVVRMKVQNISSLVKDIFAEMPNIAGTFFLPLKKNDMTAIQKRVQEKIDALLKNLKDLLDT